jgi:hypothetical protein
MIGPDLQNARIPAEADVYELQLGIEHLMTGVELVPSLEGAGIRFEMESASIVRAVSTSPFHALWRSRGQGGYVITLHATQLATMC